MYAIPCVSWVKRGAAKKHPDKVRLSEAEIQNVIGRPAQQVDDNDQSDEEDIGDDPDVVPGVSQKRAWKKQTEQDEKETEEDEDFNKRYGFDDYDDEQDSDASDEKEDDDGEDDGDWTDVDDDEEHNYRPTTAGQMRLSSLTHYASAKDDPYIESDVSEDSDLEITEDDNMIAVGKVCGDYFELRAYIYNENDDNLYVHHDVLLPSFPLCLEWMDFDPGEPTQSNFVALGSMTPEIQIWDLDMVDCLEPAFILGAEKKVHKKKRKTSSLGHTDAVLDLAWNHHTRKVLASGSVDFTIGLWDLEQGIMVTQIKQHMEKVQALQWHPCEPQSLLSGSFDETVKVFDCRSPEDAHKTWNVNGEVEKVLWNHHNPFHFFASTDKGQVSCLDVRNTEPVFSMKAHQSAATGLAICSQIPGCLVTSSADKSVKVWDVRNPKECRKIFSKNLSLGQLHCVSASPDSSLTFFVGGERDVKIVNLKKNPEVCSVFHVPCIKPEGKEYALEVQADESSSSEEDENPLTLMKNSKSSANKMTKKQKKKKKGKGKL